MRNPFHALLQRLRSLVMSCACSVMNFAWDRIIASAEERSPRYILGMWVDHCASQAFNYAYPGSDEEERDALDSSIPAAHMSDRQRAIALEAFENPSAYCINCCWLGFIHEAPAPDYCCPSCGDDRIRWDDRARAWVPYRDHRALMVLPVCTAVKGGGS